MNSRQIFEKYCSKEIFDKLVLMKHVPQLLVKMEEEYSDLTAVITNEGKITYKELCNEVKGVVNELTKNSILPKQNVGVFAPNNFNFTKASLGIMACGAVATLLPFQLDEKTVYGCCLKYSLTALLYDEALSEKVEFAKKLLPNVKFIKIEKFNIDNDNCYNFDINPKDPSCIVMTGGTTGKSKGAILSHLA